MTSTRDIPENLYSLHSAEELLRQKARSMVAADPRLQLHLAVTEAAMDLADSLRKFDTHDEDLKVAMILGMRTFNAFGASIKLSLSGYHQNSALILRDVMETAFLLDLFAGERPLIERWRFADKKARIREFSPVKVREALDARDGFTSKKRAEMYELLSELAGHPNMKSSWMMRPQKDGEAVIGPFVEATALEAVISEIGRLAVQVGEQLDKFFPANWGLETRVGFAKLKRSWLETFYPTTTAEP
ncbi:hypothetical protein [Bradyrhizobium sp. BR 10261]|uniref:hypothetical protein n=1 Tax=Bradyrhizobium sp. BR 10261 TaxID=2749992 RepID=UPI001C64AC94|nr:hypothetical protein [Bradyrhizobium sp. BR 10261]MBW7967234.1 hypothetical protein [Bradyrhizobium sp. BR 10261]